MKVQVLIKVEISNINIDDVMKEFPTLRMYLQWFQRTSNGMFISKAEVSREDGKDTLIGDSIDLRNSLLDWGFNEAEQDKRQKYIRDWKLGKISGTNNYTCSSFVRNYMLQKCNYKCEKCGWGEFIILMVIQKIIQRVIFKYYVQIAIH